MGHVPKFCTFFLSCSNRDDSKKKVHNLGRCPKSSDPPQFNLETHKFGNFVVFETPLVHLREYGIQERIQEISLSREHIQP